MFNDMHYCPLCDLFNDNGDIYKTVEGGLTQGDGKIFIKYSPAAKDFPIRDDEDLSQWAERHGEPLYQAIREYKPINKAKYDAKWKAIREARGY